MRIRYIVIFIFLLSSIVIGQNLKGGGEANPNLLTDQNALKNWQDLRFGMFIHWGPVALRGTEIGWSRGREISFQEYDLLYQEFNPILFNAREWVTTAKAAGMKYIIFVTKHHDGFTLWDSEFTNYDIMESSYKRDIVKELSDECKAQGILFGTYYSILDWYHPDYPLKFRQGKKKIWKKTAKMDRYVDFLKNQVRELVDKYQTQILWFDGEWEEPWLHEMGMDLYKFGRDLNPNILINNRVDKGREGMEGASKSDKFAGDFETPEQRVGRYNIETPWESCITICKQWAWKPNDALKSFQECIYTLVRTAGGDGNLLLNVGPMLDGRIEQRQIDRLKEIGNWLEINGESIYQTSGGPIPPQDWIVTTQKENKIYLHMLKQIDETILVPGLKSRIKTATVLNSGEQLTFHSTPDGLSISPSKIKNENVDLIIVLEK
jgi:alpha-L-fucosidase